MESGNGWILAILGGFMLIGYCAHVIGRRLFVPRVTLLLILGALIGPSVFDIVPEEISNWFPLVAHMALAMVGFLLGEEFGRKGLKEKGPRVFGISIGETLAATAMVFVVLWLIGTPLVLAIILAGMAPASAPAAIFETVRECQAKGPLTKTLLGVVAIDDAWGIILFSTLFVVAQGIGGEGSSMQELGRGLWEVFGAVLVGGVIGAPMAWLTGRVKEGEPALIETIGFVFLCSGLATLLQVSYLLAAMVLGTVVANLARHHQRPFHAIEGISEPFFAVFFLLAGFRFELETLAKMSLVGVVYVLARAAGKIAGAWMAGSIMDAPEVVKKRIGWCLLPQAGVALGFALLVQEKLPKYGDTILPLIVATTVLFEVTGPLFARWHLKQAGELHPE